MVASTADFAYHTLTVRAGFITLNRTADKSVGLVAPLRDVIQAAILPVVILGSVRRWNAKLVRSGRKQP